MTTSDDPDKRRFEVALKTRNFEIDLFWKRSFFFWRFISAAFVGYAASILDRKGDLNWY
jgi:hypothetical protein